MDDEQLLGALNTLIQLDIDAVCAYGQAVGKVRQAGVRAQLERFGNDHRRHVAELSAAVRARGGTPPELSFDYTEWVVLGFTSARRPTAGTKSALEGMKTHEKLIHRRYGEAREWPVREGLRRLLRRSAEDEETHLAYLQNVVALKVWEPRPAAVEDTWPPTRTH